MWAAAAHHTRPPDQVVPVFCLYRILCVCIIGVVSYYDTYVRTYVPYLPVGTGDPRLSVLARENGPWVMYVCRAWKGRGGEGRGGGWSSQ